MNYRAVVRETLSAGPRIYVYAEEGQIPIRIMQGLHAYQDSHKRSEYSNGCIDYAVWEFSDNVSFLRAHSFLLRQGLTRIQANGSAAPA